MVEDREWIKDRARALGFDLCGVVGADKFPELELFPEWLSRGYAGEMKYLEDPRRSEPSRVMPGLHSAIVCALNYNTAHPYSTEAAASASAHGTAARGWISRYAWGDDYHEVMWARLNALAAALKEKFPEPFQARAYADTGPVAEESSPNMRGLAGWAKTPYS
jgi:epoxyqueuosine reductase